MNEQKTKTMREHVFYFPGRALSVTLEPHHTFQAVGKQIVIEQDGRETIINAEHVLWIERRSFDVKVSEPAPARA